MMENLYVYAVSFLLILLVLSIFAWFCVWFYKSLWVRSSALIMYVASIILIGHLLYSMLGFPKPLDLEHMNPQQVRIVSFYEVPSHYFFYLVANTAEETPRFYFEPWTEEKAKKFRRAQAATRTQEFSGAIIYQFLKKEDTQRGEREIYPEPQERYLPPKN